MGALKNLLMPAAAPKIPEPVVPAAPAPMSRTDTGANIVVGADKGKDSRVSGGKGSSKTKTTGDVLGNLGRSGLSI